MEQQQGDLQPLGELRDELQQVTTTFRLGGAWTSKEFASQFDLILRVQAQQRQLRKQQAEQPEPIQHVQQQLLALLGAEDVCDRWWKETPAAPQQRDLAQDPDEAGSVCNSPRSSHVTWCGCSRCRAPRTAHRWGEGGGSMPVVQSRDR